MESARLPAIDTCLLRKEHPSEQLHGSMSSPDFRQTSAVSFGPAMRWA
jgi:hypothetical protein